MSRSANSCRATTIPVMRMAPSATGAMPATPCSLPARKLCTASSSEVAPTVTYGRVENRRRRRASPPAAAGSSAVRRCTCAAQHTTSMFTMTLIGCSPTQRGWLVIGAAAEANTPMMMVSASSRSDAVVTGPLPTMTTFITATSASRHISEMSSMPRNLGTSVWLRTSGRSTRCHRNSAAPAVTVAPSSVSRTHSPRSRRPTGSHSSAHMTRSSATESSGTAVPTNSRGRSDHCPNVATVIRLAPAGTRNSTTVRCSQNRRAAGCSPGARATRSVVSIATRLVPGTVAHMSTRGAGSPAAKNTVHTQPSPKMPRHSSNSGRVSARSARRSVPLISSRASSPVCRTGLRQYRS